MPRHIELAIALRDHFNPALGYRMTVSDGQTGEIILNTSVAPDTGNDLRTYADCLHVAQMYI